MNATIPAHQAKRIQHQHKQALPYQDESGGEPPFSLQAEQAVLGGLMLDYKAWPKVAERLEEGDFYRHDHRLIWRAMASLAGSGVALDVVTLAEVLERSEWLKDAGGLAYLRAMAENTPSAANIMAYAGIVLERATLRRYMAMGTEVKALAANPAGRSLADIEGMVERWAHTLKTRHNLCPSGYTLRTVEDLASQPPQAYRIKSVFPETGIAAIFGPSGSGKSFLGFDLAGAIGGRADWFGYRVKPGPVVCLVLEGEGGLRNRVAAYRTQHGGKSLAGVRFIASSFDLLTSNLDALVRAIRGAGMECPTVFVDTLNRAAPGMDENSSVDMGRIIAACKRLQAETGGLVVLVHHSGKDAAKGMRGHSSLFAALDAVIQVSRDGERREWVLTKSKDGRDGEAHGFRLAVVGLGEDEDGDLVTSCVVDPDGQGAIERQPLGKNGTKAFDVLADLYQQHRANLAASGEDPDKALVSFSDWCNALQGIIPKNRASEARTEVLRKNYAVAEGVFVRLVPVPVGSVLVPNGTAASPNCSGSGSTPTLVGGTERNRSGGRFGEARSESENGTEEPYSEEL